MVIKEIRLQTDRLSASYSWYTEVIDLPAIYLDNNHIAVTAGKSRLVFEESSAQDHPFYHFAFNIPSNKFEEAYEWMKKKTELIWLEDYKSYVADFANWHARSFYFTDPGGNILEFIARFELKDSAEETFSGALVRNISEIGLVFPACNYRQLVQDVRRLYQLPHFDKQPSLPHFNALGDDEGLFIIVPEHRVWYATKNRESGIFPLEIDFLQRGSSYNFKYFPD